MDRVIVGLAAALLALPAAAQPVDPLAAPILSLHNRERAALNLPPLVWDAGLATQATAWARHLTQVGKLIHSTEEEAPDQGENLTMATHGFYDTTALVAGWANERKVFVNGAFPDISSTGKWRDAGHYSQMVWRTTTKVGCGVATGGGWDYLVCRYNPPGNYLDEKAY